jgi:hypothetical protein
MSYYGKTETWKIIYNPKEKKPGVMGVAFVEATDRQQALYTFSQEYAGQYHTVERCEKLIK